MQKTNLLYLHKPNEKQILLAMKKRRFGAGKWNGVGGKVEGSESIIESLMREVKEEIGVDIREEDLVQVATIDFLYENNPDWNNESHVFFTEKWGGIPVETEEMRPEWFSTDNLPYKDMWIDDPHWLPKVLEGKKVRGIVNLNKEGNEILEIKVEEI